MYPMRITVSRPAPLSRFCWRVTGPYSGRWAGRCGIQPQAKTYHGWTYGRPVMLYKKRKDAEADVKHLRQIGMGPRVCHFDREKK
jgi:hypothetical protein